METIVFLITGAFIGKEIIVDGLVTITKMDFIKVLIFYVLMNLCRYAMIYMLSPLINKLGWPVSNKDLIIFTYGGLRGAIALSLALMIAINDDYTDRFREIVILYVTGMITLTVLFNGLTIKLLMKKIKFKNKNFVNKKMK